jgi:alpha-D-ribose 1-methylphosphonate 5-triphosphate synthase subunit PhnG
MSRACHKTVSAGLYCAAMDEIDQSRQINLRKALLRACSKATEAEMSNALQSFPTLPAPADLRPPESGLVMVRGRIGGLGNAFNVGEAIVTRASVRLADGRVGHSYLLGRSGSKARLAATIDALGQDAVDRGTLESAFVAAVLSRVDSENTTRHEETAATRVNFFTLARGEDQ